MGVMPLMKNITLLFLLISALLLSTSLTAGIGRRFLYKLADEAPVTSDEEISEPEEAATASDVHERFLKDYGNYEPAPALRKPPSMLINN